MEIPIETARTEIRTEWRNWDGDKASIMAPVAFYFWLEENRPDLLTFQCKGDRCQRVKIWIEFA